MRLSDLNRVNRRAIRSAGPRYMPGQDSNAPNLQIAAINEALEGIALTDEFRARVETLRCKVRKEWGDTPANFRRELRRTANDPDKLILSLSSLRDAAAPDAGAAVSRATREAAAVERLANRRLRRLQDALLASKARDTEAHRSLESNSYRVREFASAVEAVLDFSATPSVRAVTTNRLLILGRWGTGKTHSLCDITERRMARRLPTLLCLGQQLLAGADPLESICSLTGLATTPRRLLRALQRLGERINGRALLIVDAINEGDRAAWRRALPGIQLQLEEYPNVAAVLSCRQPFDEHIVSSRVARRFVTVYHEGFSEQEFDAQLSFFHYYGIPAPHFPLITEEFSRPLFLQLLCKGIARLSKQNQHRQLRQFASGQRGMTYLLESFVDHVGANIEDELGLPRGMCWKILKGHSVTLGGPIVGIAPAMAAQPSDTLTRSECLQAMELFLSPPRRDTARNLLLRMVADGLLAEDLRWTSTGQVEVVRFPYQRFGDHIIARHLLSQHLNLESVTTIRRSFYQSQPLGRIFELSPGGMSYRMPGLAAAMMVEFPERVRRRVPEAERELVFYLPRSRQLVGPLKDAFLESLPWRSNESFSQQTHDVVSALLRDVQRDHRNEVIEVLVGLATREGHIYSSARLQDWVGRMGMAERDLMWSEYVRLASDTSIVLRLIAWVERTAPATISAQAAETSGRLLALLLTSTVRPLRDRATRALFLIGLKHPDVLFATTLDFLGFNDPYVPERLLAACYGVSMSLWADPAGQALRDALPAFARRLVRDMFVPPAAKGTRHALARGYALGTVAVARTIDRNVIPTRQARFLRAPFNVLPVPFDATGALTPAQRAETSPAIDTDFGNYTLGHLVPGRRNYDDNNPDYQLVKNQVLGRMHHLGYSHAQFGSIDRIISNYGGLERTQDGNKTDRYGKKYSWIAYFELGGLRVDRGLLTSDWRDPSRSDADIDPSFPQQTSTWSGVRIPGVFAGAPVDPIEWLHNGPTPRYDHLLNRSMVDAVRGRWVLLDGFLEQDQDARRVFTFLRGILVSPKDVDRLQRGFMAIEYPGNDAVPRPPEDHQTFGGEIPWSPHFGQWLRRRDGQARRNVQRAFGGWTRGKERGGVRVELPTHDVSWGHTYSTLNENTGADVPAPAICEALQLVNHARTLDLFDSAGRPASLYRRVAEVGGTPGRGSLLYMRRSLLRRYLKMTSQRLVWMVWGERNFTTASGLHHRQDIRDAWPDYAHIHRRFLVL
ncbi:MAG: hypothetical protein Q8O42_17895 [Acidobacteriota bacterium]|nr:hypothetical protein [Acidobacteriota bacterium]